MTTAHASPGTAKTAALYVVATPLGNLGDITLRAVETLRTVDAIAAEDTRHTKRLLDHLGIVKPMFALHEHNEARAARGLLERLRGGQDVALVSDAGTPGISDPGARAVAAARDAGFRVVPVPGPNAAVTALSAGGVASGRFLFLGFLPAKAGARRHVLQELAALPYSLVFHEAPHRVLETVEDMAQVLGGGREIVICRELTKIHETVVRLPLANAREWLAEDENRQRGEFVLIVTGAAAESGDDEEALRVLGILLAELPLRQAVQLAARITGAARKLLYERALALSGRAPQRE